MKYLANRDCVVNDVGNGALFMFIIIDGISLKLNFNKRKK